MDPPLQDHEEHSCPYIGQGVVAIENLWLRAATRPRLPHPTSPEQNPGKWS